METSLGRFTFFCWQFEDIVTNCISIWSSFVCQRYVRFNNWHVTNTSNWILQVNGQYFIFMGHWCIENYSALIYWDTLNNAPVCSINAAKSLAQSSRKASVCSSLLSSYFRGCCTCFNVETQQRKLLQFKTVLTTAVYTTVWDNDLK